jgi:hypothetical protein
VVEELQGAGGLGSAFAAFLRFRADLLEPEFLDALRGVRETAPALDAAQRAAALLAAFGSRSPELLATLDPEPLWSTVSRCAFAGRWKGERVVVQIAREPLTDQVLEAFEKKAMAICAAGAKGAADTSLLHQFRRWIRLADDPARERSYLNAAAGLRASVDYPVPIPEISAARVLSWRWTEGTALDRLFKARDAGAVMKFAEMVLEQICVLAMVDADIDTSQIVMSGGRLTVRRANRLDAIPPPQVRTSLRYVSAVLSANSPVAVRSLLKLAWGRVAVEHEARMLDELSGLAPELKGDRRFAPTANLFETNWRALTKVNGARPLHVDTMHRNLLSVAYRNAEACPDTDCLTDAQWPVVGRLLRLRLGNMFDRQTISEWFVGSGLLLIESFRQANRLADEFRDNEVAVGVDQSPRGEEHEREANRSTGVWILIGVFFVMFIVSIRWAAVLPTPYSTAGTVVAVIGALGLFWTVSRVG